MPQVRALSPRPKSSYDLWVVAAFSFVRRARTREGPQRKKQSGGLFLARSAQSGTEGKAFGRQADSMRSRRRALSPRPKIRIQSFDWVWNFLFYDLKLYKNLRVARMSHPLFFLFHHSANNRFTVFIKQYGHSTRIAALPI